MLDTGKIVKKEIKGDRTISSEREKLLVTHNSDTITSVDQYWIK
jgi:hypothetical protein